VAEPEEEEAPVSDEAEEVADSLEEEEEEREPSVREVQT